MKTKLNDANYRLEKLELENKFYKEIIQDCLDLGKIYHFQKKRLKELGFEVNLTKGKR